MIELGCELGVDYTTEQGGVSLHSPRLLVRRAIKIGKVARGATSTPHQPANAGFAPGLRLNVGECG